jgi:hypothetical protein
MRNIPEPVVCRCLRPSLSSCTGAIGPEVVVNVARVEVCLLAEVSSSVDARFAGAGG